MVGGASGLTLDPQGLIGNSLLRIKLRFIFRQQIRLLPLIDKQWNIVSLQMPVEVAGLEFDRLSCKERTMAFSAIRRFAEPLARHAIDGLALGADYMQ